MLFQSLLGFLMRCDDMVEPDLPGLPGVSIPAGFSDALRLSVGDGTQVKYGFQSLLGFLMRCDFFLLSYWNHPVYSFNPCWVF